mgnify:CR=1 FL=1|jgi:hypothetical protein|tara:strand:+ start:1810 stop:2331 length:522 start_codon:yes stop_codon:yes gene_type:complete
MASSEIWVNSDGLEVRFGSEKATLRLGGKLKTFGALSEIRLKILGANVPATDAPIDKKVSIPTNSYIDAVTSQLFVDTTFTSGGSATLDIGLMNDDGDGTYSTLDDNGIDAAIAVATLAADYDTVPNGAQMGTSPVNSTTATLPLVPSYGYNTAAFTAGAATLVLRYRAPVTS